MMSESAHSPAHSNEGDPESQFWESPPAYSLPPPRISDAPRPAPSTLRTIGARVLFAILFSGVMALLGFEALVAFGLSWADVRALPGKF